jgi:hypothetical protein
MKMKRLDEIFMMNPNGEYIRNKIIGEKLLPYINQGYKVISIKINNNYYNQIKMAIINWMSHYGPVPKGYVIHHKKFSNDKKINAKLKLNDNINNLQCITKQEHHKIHHSGKNSHFYGKDHSGKNNPMYGRVGVFAPMYGRSGEKNPMYGRAGALNSMYGRSGEKHHGAKLTDKQAKKVRFLSYVKKRSQLKVADEFGVSRSCINGILQGYTYNSNHLTKQELIKQFVNE